VPQGNLIPEQEVFIGPVALAPYETPGTRAFGKTVLPFVKDHNTILLENHGIVCWADTVSHAEWYVEVVENYCKTVLIASQLRPKLNEIPPDKLTDLLAIKKRLGLPDPRLRAGAEPIETVQVKAEVASARNLTPNEIDEFIRRLTKEVDAFLRD
jgi:L-fuculose-phosphate aldolase